MRCNGEPRTRTAHQRRLMQLHYCGQTRIGFNKRIYAFTNVACNAHQVSIRHKKNETADLRAPSFHNHRGRQALRAVATEAAGVPAMDSAEMSLLLSALTRPGQGNTSVNVQRVTVQFLPQVICSMQRNPAQPCPSTHILP